ncbi:lipase family protein [Ectobacillus ponti]|uniref:Lipase family protein n=1 Tax=Ectobacillus ponti TaxID=2961894 RepID=A0AA41XBB8_9BACI|nr:lipase family protein [Ectobacillus ponti]MCP8969825.1 lipase family protein [Ectobacillus ponti]
MKLRLYKQYSVFALVFVLFSAYFAAPADAAYSDNKNSLYYELSNKVYEGQTAMQDRLTALYGRNSSGTPNLRIIDFIDINNYIDGSGNLLHPMGALQPGKTKKFEKTGFSAAVVVDEANGKLFVTFAGSKDFYDYVTAGKAVSATPPGQEYQAQLYLNYIYKTYPNYQGYKWYFTGHSLGGWLATKMYLDIAAARWLNDPSVLVYGGAAGKSAISGVYTFNPLPISDVSISGTQWTANKNGAYKDNVMNSYIENEWLNGVSDMHPGKLAYVGSTGPINTGLKYYSAISYVPSSSISTNLTNYYLYCALSLRSERRAITNGHGIVNFASLVSY